MWSSLLTILIIYGVFLAFYAAIFLAILVGSFIIALLSQSGIPSAIPTLIISIVAIVLLFLGLVFLIRFVTRFCIVEVPLAIENKLTATQTIGRSRSLTQGNIDRIFWIFIVGGLISLPLQIIASIVGNVSQAILARSLAIDPNSGLFIATNLIVSYILGIILGSVLIPFWQSIKATIYYDLRSRKEGLDLQLRDR